MVGHDLVGHSPTVKIFLERDGDTHGKPPSGHRNGRPVRPAERNRGIACRQGQHLREGLGREEAPFPDTAKATLSGSQSPPNHCIRSNLGPCAGPRNERGPPGTIPIIVGARPPKPPRSSGCTPSLCSPSAYAIWRTVSIRRSTLTSFPRRAGPSWESLAVPC